MSVTNKPLGNAALGCIGVDVVRVVFAWRQGVPWLLRSSWPHFEEQILRKAGSQKAIVTRFVALVAWSLSR
ncbi:hypothetical protein [Ferrimicrobium acidiphilum]|jgi:hypothetical protein|uniref:hypothetical protein n=1 Tax=Ferrimicrobium acidiphilum TaxID=121039 RepID=UPI0034DD2A24